MSESLLANLLLLSVILINFFCLGSARLVACIRAIAVQGVVLALLPVAVHGLCAHSLVLGLGTLCFKGVLIPGLLLRAIREVRIRREMEPFVGFATTLFLGTLIAACAFLCADWLPLAAAHHEGLLVPVALTTIFSGFLLLMTRRKALTQVLGYLMLENGIFIFAVLLSEALPLMVEAGMLLDLLVGIFIMGIVINQIRREFSTISTEQLTALKE
ncbi:MAG: hydrogenase [Desulfuromonadaceae bacterium]|nr:hydrogenase [Desulfuromonadaceae bacterium]